MLLIPEQIYDIIEAKIETNKRKSMYYEDMIKSQELTGFENTSISALKQNQSQIHYQRLKNKGKELDRILNTSHIIEKRNLERIDIGTFFYYKWLDEDDIKSAYLVEQTISPSIDNKFISIESPFGKSVKGAKEGDIIKYKTSDNMPVQTIQILKISKNRNDYLQFISSDRTSQMIKNFKNNENKYEKILSITENQSRLIKIKLKKLKEKILNIKNDEEKEKIREKISFLSEVLKSQIKDTPNDGTIGIGSIVEFSLSNGYYYSLELIGKAYTTEYPCQYVEYISSLGNALYGKKAGDIFTFMGKNNKEYTGEILNVYNKNYEEIDLPKTYKKMT